MKLLNSKQVEYLVIGGWAVGFYGYPRATGDIDIWVANTYNNAVKIVAVFKEFGFDVPKLSTELFTKEDNITRIGIPPIRIEVLTTIAGVSFKECYSNRSTIILDDILVNIISLKDLKKNKAASKRYKDLDDLDKLK